MREADKFKKLEERELPKAEEAWKLLEDFHRIVVFKESMSNRTPNMPQRADESWEEFFKKSKISLRLMDISTRAPNGAPIQPRQDQVDGLVNIVTVGFVRAYRRMSPLEFVMKEYMIRYGQIRIMSIFIRYQISFTIKYQYNA